MTFKYVPYAGDSPAPALDVTLLGADGMEVETRALIDTGSEYTMLSFDTAKRLGVDPASLESVESQTAGGITTGDRRWSHGPEKPRVRVDGCVAPIAPILKPQLSIVALGRDFLASFRYAADERAEEFTLDPYEEPTLVWAQRVGKYEPD